MDWEQIEKEFIEEHKNSRLSAKYILNWFKQRIESELPPPKLSEEEKNEFYTTNITADNIKARYGK